MHESAAIESGKSYWISFAGQQFRAVADREAIIPGWWWCKADDGTLAMFPENAFLYRIAPPATSRPD